MFSNSVRASALASGLTLAMAGVYCLGLSQKGSIEKEMEKKTKEAKETKFTNSEELKVLLEKNIDGMKKLIVKLPEYDLICNRILDLCGVKGKLTVTYDIGLHGIGEKRDNVIHILPQYFVDKDPSELEFVVAHEIGHYKYPYKHLVFLPIVGFSALVISFGFTVVPTTIICGGMIFSTILLKRREESWCDGYAAKMVGVDGGIKHFTATNQAWQKLGWRQKLWNYDYSHPSAINRVHHLIVYKNLKT